MREIITFTEIPSQTEIAYIAGIIDSLCTFSIKKTVLKTHIAWNCELIVRTTDYRIIHFLNKSFGVNSWKDESYNLKYSPDEWKDRMPITAVKAFVCRGEFLDYILYITMPYMRFSLEKAILIKEFRSTFNGRRERPISNETQEKREEIRSAFRKLQRQYNR
jgi:hypothetical protein